MMEGFSKGTFLSFGTYRLQSLYPIADFIDLLDSRDCRSKQLTAGREALACLSLQIFVKILVLEFRKLVAA